MSWMYQNAAHRFLRNPNVQSSIFKRAWTRKSAFENTLEVLEDPKSGKKVYLIGTTNSSTSLASRTEKLINEVKPDSLHIQTCEQWYERAKQVKVENQEQFNRINRSFNDIMIMRAKNYPNHLRGLYFKMRFYGWMLYMNYYLSFPNDFNPWRPGVEMLWALKAAEQNNAKITYYGGMFNKYIVNSLSGENNLSLFRVLYSTYRGNPISHWRREAVDFWNVLRTSGGAAFSENLDNKGISWFVKWFEKFHPEMKDILVDEEDCRFFKELYNDKAKTIVAVVNHWHLPGIRAHWQRTIGTDIPGEAINPIGDMDINAVQEAGVINDFLRSHFSRKSRTEPATWANYLTHYHKSVMEPERERHVFFGGHNDHHMSHGLFNLENGADHDHEHRVELKGETLAAEPKELLDQEGAEKKSKGKGKNKRQH